MSLKVWFQKKSHSEMVQFQNYRNQAVEEKGREI